jgi:hypothetical protein
LKKGWRNNSWVLHIYPVVTSRGTDNTGGVEHLRGNMEAYRSIGLKSVVLSRLSWPFISRDRHGIWFNLVPGTATPATPRPEGAAGGGSGWRRYAAAIRRSAIHTLVRSIIGVLRIRVVHQRANSRFMLGRVPARCLHFIELNDEFLPSVHCDGYLTVVSRPDLGQRQLCHPWPVPERGRFDPDRFIRCFRRLMSVDAPRLLLLGSGGTPSLRPVLEFIQGHPWIAGRQFSLHAFGDFHDVPQDPRLHWRKWVDGAGLEASNFDAALVYYDQVAYSDQRLSLGFPTKLAAYIDCSLPVFSNRAIISGPVLGGFDIRCSVESPQSQLEEFAGHLQALRAKTLPEQYGKLLADFASEPRGAHVSAGGQP